MTHDTVVFPQGDGIYNAGYIFPKVQGIEKKAFVGKGNTITIKVVASQ